TELLALSSQPVLSLPKGQEVLRAAFRAGARAQTARTRLTSAYHHWSHAQKPGEEFCASDQLSPRLPLTTNGLRLTPTSVAQTVQKCIKSVSKVYQKCIKTRS